MKNGKTGLSHFNHTKCNIVCFTQKTKPWILHLGFVFFACLKEGGKSFPYPKVVVQGGVLSDSHTSRIFQILPSNETIFKPLTFIFQCFYFLIVITFVFVFYLLYLQRK